jgi:hypothetical protein
LFASCARTDLARNCLSIRGKICSAWGRGGVVGIVWNVRSCYRMIVTVKKMREDWLDGRPSNSNVEVEEKRWTTLWRTKVPSKIRVFLWRLARTEIR